MVKIDADWLKRPGIKRIVECLGAENIRFVGGVVRDTLIGRKVHDIDAATVHTPHEATKLLEACDIKVIPTGIDHGTVTAIADSAKVEVTTLRQDMETDGRRAVVAFTDNWKADAARRDFTFNALYLSADGTLNDPFDGIKDLKAGRVRFIGNAETRIEEDALRILRFFRFHAWYGKGQPDETGLAACKQKVVLLKALSAERVRDELLKLIAAPKPMEALTALERTGATAVLPLGTLNSVRLQHYIDNEDRFEFKPDAILRLSAWLALEPEAVPIFAKRFRLSKKQREQMLAVVTALHATAPATPEALHAFIYQYGNDAAKCALFVQEVCGEALVQTLKDWPVPEFPLKGGDLIAAGVDAGPAVSKLMKQLEQDWVASDFSLSRDELLKRV
ncbi:CCA tRNA nucleotidyltransferase [Kordiimonas gwangyangensis]|uniref:CCA tRNA nucleotidyltransferase n=1 Tax=Kordiimonas gwangyangensis TaxID=288022 RepID=UPI00036EEFA8|nr:CCA tRNA nucleotidyltransferase [Kordiimonas gwangyangensis]